MFFCDVFPCLGVFVKAHIFFKVGLVPYFFVCWGQFGMFMKFRLVERRKFVGRDAFGEAN